MMLKDVPKAICYSKNYSQSWLYMCIMAKIDHCHRNRNSATGTVCRISVLKKQELFNYFYLSQGSLKISKPFTESTDLTEKSFTKIFI
jgi:hypothetical protein